ncbi:hypothetical protein QFZ82_002264 [Streptomyces sp. V4I23]|nr:hypothetical protein [Streptomyces sp. V4I23]MDQ1007779.1 hypothetical protein [Streptomyces sp. V4I23]
MIAWAVSATTPGSPLDWGDAEPRSRLTGDGYGAYDAYDGYDGR